MEVEHRSSEYRFCPRCTGRFEERVLKEGDPGRLVCESCGFVFYLGPKLVAGAIFELDGGILLVQRDIEPGYGKWTFPGGFVERGERAEAAAEREVLEETGLEIEVKEIVGLYTYDGQIPAIAVFAARAIRGKPVPLDETMDVKSFRKDRLPWTQMAFPSTEQALKDYLRKV
ncbi:MAG: NUDIX hydrolase [Actinomycetota bacterium]|nr:NUDIX hydrolase [Actinomycetota bacterium]